MEGESDPPGDKQKSNLPEDGPPEVPDGTVQQKSSKKKKGKKRSREAASRKETEDSNVSREDPVDSPAKVPPEERLKKQRKETTETEQSFSRQEDPPKEDTTPDGPIDSFVHGETERDEFTPAPDAVISKQKRVSKKKAGISRSALSLSEGASGNFSTRGPQMNFPDMVNFSYNEDTLLISNPIQCDELTRQVRGGHIGLPPVANLFFREEYIEAAHARKLVIPPSLRVNFNLLLHLLLLINLFPSFSLL